MIGPEGCAGAMGHEPQARRHECRRGERERPRHNWATKWVLFFLMAGPAFGQVQLMVVDGQMERAAPALYDFGELYPSEAGSAQFRLRNTSALPATVTTLAVAGAGFSLAGAAVPVTLNPQAALDFTVKFQSADLGSYSAALRSDGVSTLLTATVLPRLTLGGSRDFGGVVPGSSVQQRFTLTNQTPQNLTVPAISVQGSDYSLAGIPPSGQLYQPKQTGEFTVVFAPHTYGSSTGTLIIGDRSFVLTGSGVDPGLPRPYITVDLPQIASAQQGRAIIIFDKPVKTSGTGALTLDFGGPADPTVAFASGGRNAVFTVAPGDTQVAIPFQTGTTAGTLTLAVQLGGASDQLRIPIPAAPAGVTAVKGTRSPSSVEVMVTGFDNTRTLGALSFTFYDAGGNALEPGAIRADATADFTRYFSTGDVGGAFLLHAVFPVTGDTSRIASCDITLTNSAGNAKAPKATF